MSYLAERITQPNSDWPCINEANPFGHRLKYPKPWKIGKSVTCVTIFFRDCGYSLWKRWGLRYWQKRESIALVICDMLVLSGATRDRVELLGGSPGTCGRGRSQPRNRAAEAADSVAALQARHYLSVAVHTDTPNLFARSGSGVF